jgi:hypothetical protein
MFSARSTVAALAVVALTAALGCGSQTGSPQPTGTGAVPAGKTAHLSKEIARTGPLSRTQLISQADAICRRVNLKRAAIRLETRQDYALLLPLATYERTALEQMRSLTPPASMAVSWKKILADTQTAIDSIDGLAQAGIAGDSTELERESLVGGKALRETFVLAKREGFKDCAKS